MSSPRSLSFAFPSLSLAAAPVLAAALFLASGLAGCGHDIGDDCQTSADCDPNGTRACDLSQPGGYCTISGCDGTSCPEDSVCIRYFPEQYLTQSCDPTIREQCAADEVCLDAKVCAKRSYEQRACAKGCSGNDDCRGGYECREAGTRGSMLLSVDPRATARFCAPLP